MSGWNFTEGIWQKPPVRKCEECGADYTANSRNQKYCCTACKLRARARKEGRA